MNRRGFLKTAASAAAVSAGCSRRAALPDMLLIVTSQQHADTFRSSPALSTLAGRGVSFENAYCAAPASGPSRAALLTGRMPSESGVVRNGQAIRAGIPNLGEWLREQAGYQTYYAGKWNLPRTYQEPLPGFDVLPGGIEGQGSLGDAAVSRACQCFLRNRRDASPFLLVVSLHQPSDIGEWLRLNAVDPGELPYPEIRDELPPLPDNFGYEAIEPKFLQELRQSREPVHGNWSEQHWRYYLWSYRRYVEMVDGEVGRILDAVDDTGRDRNTVEIFTADHGEGLGHHRMVREASPYDESSKVPLVIAWPGRPVEGRRDAASVVSAVDIVPTLAELAGVAAPPGAVGSSLLPLVEDSAARDGYVVTEIPPNIGRTVRTRRYKYVTFAGDTVDQLFDIDEDPGETRNLADNSALASVLEEHKRLLRDWGARLEPAPNLPNEDVWWHVSAQV